MKSGKVGITAGFTIEAVWGAWAQPGYEPRHSECESDGAPVLLGIVGLELTDGRFVQVYVVRLLGKK